MNALNFDTINLSFSNFVFAKHEAQNEVISADDMMFKVFDLTRREIKDNISQEVDEAVTAMNIGCDHLVYSQGRDLFSLPLQEETRIETNSASLMTSFNSKVSKVVFNLKRRLIIAFSEDDELCVINLENMNVFKYKSGHEGTIRNAAVSPDGDFLVTSGCDGYLCVYQFSNEGQVNLKKKKLYISKKVSYESSQKLDLDINSQNLVAIGGNLNLRTLLLNSAFSEDNYSIIPENSISSKADINYLRWVEANSTYLITLDESNFIKIWNFATKTCLANFQFRSDLSILALDVTIKTLSSSNSYFNIFVSDSEGNLNYSNNLQSEEAVEKKHAFKDVQKVQLNQPKSDLDSDIEKLFAEMEEEEKTLQGSVNNNNNPNELLDLSMIEDENGEIKDKDEIEKARQEKQNENKVESFADDIIGCLPQQAFNTVVSTEQGKDGDMSVYLCWNMIGQLVLRKEAGFKAIDVIFSDVTNKKKLSFIDVNELSIGVMNNCGVFLANKLDEENPDAYEKEDARSSAVLEFKVIGASSSNKDWTVSLAAKENPICLAMGVDWCAAFTSAFYLRVFSIYGNERMILSLPHVVTMAGYENLLAVVYHQSAPLFGSQQMRVKIMNSNCFFKEIYDGVLPLSPEATLVWFGYSEEGLLITQDSRKILRGFFFGVSNTWIPLLDLDSVNKNFWVIGMQDEEVYGVELKGFMTEPLVGSKLPIKCLKVKVPFTLGLTSDNQEEDEEESVALLEEKLFTTSLFIQHDNYRLKNYALGKQMRNVRDSDYYYVDNLKDESDINKRKIEHDKIALSLINKYIYEDKCEKILGLFEQLTNNKSRVNAIKICQYHEKRNIEAVLNEKMRSIKIKEEANANSLAHNVYFNSSPKRQEVQTSYRHSENKTKQNDNLKSSFADLAMPLNDMKALEEEVRNELGLEEDDRVNEDYSTKANLNLEKKTSNPFYRSDTNLSKSNLNIFEDLSRTISASNLANQNQAANDKTRDLSFKDVNKKIGFKRSGNEMMASATSKEETFSKHNGKKLKK